jgi:hypothetical protein
MPNPNINASVPAVDVQAVKDAFAAVLTKLPFLVNLTPGERKSTVKTGPDSVSFVQKALTATLDFPDVFPVSFDTPGFQKDVDLFNLLTELTTLAESVASQIDDTRMAVGGESMRQGMQVYEFVKTGAKTTPGLKPIAEELGKRFQKSGGTIKPPVPKTP